MYTSYFGFKENPFNLTPDPRYLFLSPYHKEALDHLLYGINERKGFIAITGGIGTGKTTLCRALLSHLDPSTKSALIFNAFISDIELLKAINQEFGLPVGQGKVSKKEYIDGRRPYSVHVQQYHHHDYRRYGKCCCLVQCRPAGVQGISEKHPIRRSTGCAGCRQKGSGTWYEDRGSVRQRAGAGERVRFARSPGGGFQRDNDQRRHAGAA